MSGSVSVIHTILPQGIPGKDVQPMTASSFREDGAIDSNMSLKKLGICFTVFVIRTRGMNVGCVVILGGGQMFKR